jgi:GntR family transcriptional regulator
MPHSSGLAKRPLYLQVHDWLVGQIAAGAWKPGAPIPNEQDLAKQAGVSAGTMRKALDQMEADQLILRKQGRGTFVVDHTSEENILRFVNLRDRNGARIACVGEMLAQTVRSATAEEQERLQLGASEPVVATKRLRRHHDRPLLVEERCLAVSHFPGLKASDVGDYRIIVLAQKHGLHYGKAIENVALSTATPEHAELLSVDVGAPLLKLDRVIFAGDDLPVEERVAFCNLKDEIVYSAEIH